ncbi:FG-GAP-like repeat-containing protein [Brumimicrobium sp.]|uniref:FG-GAP-like repeat-containing protein n=1 Tax=Brumimicrobium sp. TaxID=2029867 RepID=UPI003A93B2A1
MNYKNYTISVIFILAGFLSYAQSNCNNPTVITAGVYTVDTLIGTDVPSPICAQNGAGASAAEWFSYTPSSDYTIVVSSDLTVNYGGDTRVHVYTGVCGSLSCLAGDDDSGSGYLSEVTFNVYAGSTYLISFDNRWSANGFDFKLEEHPYTEPVVPPITFTSSSLAVHSKGAAYGIADMNGDYLDDLIAVGSDTLELHYQNTGGGFTYTEIAHDSVHYVATWSLAVGDFDKNGYNDILNGSGSGVTFLKANSNGTQYDVIQGPEYVFSQRSNFVDIDNDGHLDAFVCHDVDPNVFYMNDGAGNLQFNQGGIGDHDEGGYYGSIWTDYDNDGDMDLFVAKCRGGQSTARFNEMFRNEGNGVFTNVSVDANMADSVQTWSSAWNDFDNDGDMDAIVGASSLADGTHKFMRNNGDGTFTDVTAGSGWDTYTELNIEHVSYDFDNDGFADVLGGGGKIMFNNGDMTFTPVLLNVNNGPIGDLNNDGFLDIRVGNTIYTNGGNDNNWLKVNLQGMESNSNGIGARIEIYGAWGKQIREIRSGVGFRYMNTLNAHFGLGTADEIDSLIVWWPSGTKDMIHNPAINNSVLIVEGTENLGVSKEDMFNFKLYPNPTTDFLTIAQSPLVNREKIMILSDVGKLVKSYPATQTVFDVTELSRGVYLFVIVDDQGEEMVKQFVKK